MEGPVGIVHFLVVVTAVMGGAFALFGMFATYKQLFSKKSINKVYYTSYALMALSMFLWVLRGLIGPE